jgi:hypothetical protein
MPKWEGRKQEPWLRRETTTSVLVPKFLKRHCVDMQLCRPLILPPEVAQEVEMGTYRTLHAHWTLSS